MGSAPKAAGGDAQRGDCHEGVRTCLGECFRWWRGSAGASGDTRLPRFSAFVLLGADSESRHAHHGATSLALSDRLARAIQSSPASVGRKVDASIVSVRKLGTRFMLTTAASGTPIAASGATDGDAGYVRLMATSPRSLASRGSTSSACTGTTIRLATRCGTWLRFASRHHMIHDSAERRCRSWLNAY